MARIPDDELNRLESEVSIQRLAKAAGIELKRHGADLIGLCPFHDDHEPSLVISPKKNLWYCLGACQTGGSVIDCSAQDYCRTFSQIIHHTIQLKPGWFPTLWS